MLGHLLSNTAHHTEGLTEIDRAIALNPMALISKAVRGQALSFAGRFDDTLADMKLAIDIEPGFWIFHLVLGKAYERKGMYSQSLSELQTAWEQSDYSPEPKSYLGYTYAVSGDRKKAEDAVEELMRISFHRYVAPKCVALVYGGLGNSEEMFAWLEKAYQGKDMSLAFMNAEQRWDPYRKDPRFGELMRRVGFAR